jgi:chemotaxis signal transduction protein
MQIAPVENPRRGQAGIINLHGRIIPVFSMRVLLGSVARPPRLSDMLVIVRAGTEILALWVDEMRGVRDLPTAAAHDAEPPQKAPLLPGISISPVGIIISDLLCLLSTIPDASGYAGLDRIIPSEDRLPGAVQEEPEPDAARVDAILSERAARMLPPEPGTLVCKVTEILRFHLAYQEYALEMKFVQEVILTGEITPVPGTPDFISGICAVRGRIISLVDLRALFRIPEKGLTDLNRVIVISDGKLTFGVLADTISGVGTVAINQLVPPRPEDLPGGQRYLTGVMGGNLYVLDGAAILGDPGIIIDDA